MIYFVGGGNSNIVLFSPLLGEDVPFWLIFSKWVETTTYMFIHYFYCHVTGVWIEVLFFHAFQKLVFNISRYSLHLALLVLTKIIGWDRLRLMRLAPDLIVLNVSNVANLTWMFQEYCYCIGFVLCDSFPRCVFFWIPGHGKWRHFFQTRWMEIQGWPPKANPPRNKAIRDNQPQSSPNNASLIKVLFPSGVGIGGVQYP